MKSTSDDTQIRIDDNPNVDSEKVSETFAPQEAASDDRMRLDCVICGQSASSSSIGLICLAQCSTGKSYSNTKQSLISFKLCCLCLQLVCLFSAWVADVSWCLPVHNNVFTCG